MAKKKEGLVEKIAAGVDHLLHPDHADPKPDDESGEDAAPDSAPAESKKASPKSNAGDSMEDHPKFDKWK